VKSSWFCCRIKKGEGGTNDRARTKTEAPQEPHALHPIGEEKKEKSKKNSREGPALIKHFSKKRGGKKKRKQQPLY
jgi:hypothetical protein